MTARISVAVSATNGATQIALLPKSIGIQKMAGAFTAIPLLMAMTFAASVLFVEKRKAVKIRFNAIGTNDRPNTGKAADQAPAMSHGQHRQTENPQIGSGILRVMRLPLCPHFRLRFRDYGRARQKYVSCIPWPSAASTSPSVPS